MKKIGLITKSIREENLSEMTAIINELKKYDADIMCDTKLSGFKYSDNLEELFDFADIAVVLGGDGTILSVAKYGAAYNVPLLGLNFGHLGYLVELKKEQTNSLSKIFNEDYKIEERIMLDVKVLRDGNDVFTTSVLNDAVITKGILSKMVHLNLEIDNTYASDYYADGIIVATPTGSTAYSLSAGGPVAEPCLKAILITPVCAHSTNSRPMIITDEQMINVNIDIYHNEDVALICDGRERFELMHNDNIVVTKSNLRAKLIRFEDVNFFNILSRKLAEQQRTRGI